MINEWIGYLKQELPDTNSRIYSSIVYYEIAMELGAFTEHKDIIADINHVIKEDGHDVMVYDVFVRHHKIDTLTNE